MAEKKTAKAKPTKKWKTRPDSKAEQRRRSSLGDPNSLKNIIGELSQDPENQGLSYADKLKLAGRIRGQRLASRGSDRDSQEQ